LYNEQHRIFGNSIVIFYCKWTGIFTKKLYEKSILGDALGLKYEPLMFLKFFLLFKGTVQRKPTWVLSGINRKLMISSINKNCYGFCTFKFIETLFSILKNFIVVFLDRVARAH
jgi:cbb3-type cytochrome oxidase subunit 1